MFQKVYTHGFYCCTIKSGDLATNISQNYSLAENYYCVGVCLHVSVSHSLELYILTLKYIVEVKRGSIKVQLRVINQLLTAPKTIL